MSSLRWLLAALKRACTSVPWTDSPPLPGRLLLTKTIVFIDSLQHHNTCKRVLPGTALLVISVTRLRALKDQRPVNVVVMVPGVPKLWSISLAALSDVDRLFKVVP